MLYNKGYILAASLKMYTSSKTCEQPYKTKRALREHGWMVDLHQGQILSATMLTNMNIEDK